MVDARPCVASIVNTETRRKDRLEFYPSILLRYVVFDRSECNSITWQMEEKLVEAV